ncbi:MAG: glycosyltransferase family 2 protein [Candidatus Omnitrophota bacterium]|nr:glycosyltransferase family 2 protein [Candidatus Omnitrophota bacterium]
MNNICVIIPTYNESKIIVKLVGEIRQLGFDVLVIDDGSNDGTGELARNSGAIVLRNEQKQGKGASLRKGFAFALQHSYSAIITMDGDGQHDPKDIQQFLKAAEHNEPCLIVGNRVSDAKGMPLIRWLTNHFMSFLISLICRQKILDSQCGFRYLSMDVLKKINLKTEKFEIETEMLVATAKKGFPILSAAIKTIYAGEKSNINPFVDTLRFIKFLFKQIWTSND